MKTGLGVCFPSQKDKCFAGTVVSLGEHIFVILLLSAAARHRKAVARLCYYGITLHVVTIEVYLSV